jgi:hypothetical protein
MRVALEYYAFHDETDVSAYRTAIRDALLTAAHGFSPDNE